MPLSFSRLFSAAALFVTVAFAQNQRQLFTVRNYCVKVAPENIAQFESFVHDFLMPMNQARADNGEIAWAMLARAVQPRGTSAPCDYRVVYKFNGYPSEPDAEEPVNAALKRAKLNMTAAEMRAKLSSMSKLVDVEHWINEDGVGRGAVEKGYYMRLNHYKAADASEWLRLETTYWKPLVAELVKEGVNTGWTAWEFLFPGGGGAGDSKPYNALTVDQFPDWNSLVHGVPLGELWAKVHPHEEMTPFFEASAKTTSTYDREIYQIVDIVHPSKGASK